MVQSSPRASTRRIARRHRVPHTRVWRALLVSYHVHRVQHLGPGDFAESLEFCKWPNGSRQLHRYILFADEAQFNRDGVSNTHNSPVWEMRIPTPLWKATFNYVLVSMCGVQFWMIS